MLYFRVGGAEDVVGVAEGSTVMTIEILSALRPARALWNEGRIIGQKLPLQPKHVWSIRVRLKMVENKRDLALFNMAVDSKLKGCDLVGLRVNEVYAADHLKERASVTQSKTRKSVSFEIAETTRLALERWIKDPEMISSEYLWPSPSTRARSSRCVNMPGSCATGFFRSGSSPVPMARIRCGARKSRRSTRRPKICAPCSCSWATPRWTAPFAIRASIWWMR